MSEPEQFSVRIKVRHYELDTLGHVNHAVYHQYAEVARLEWFYQARGEGNGFADRNIAPVLLETRVKFRRELREGDTVDVTCDVSFGGSKTFEMYSEIRKLDGTVAAEVECVLGLMDLDKRKLVGEPEEQFRSAGFALAG
ncbi:acyl-CoA thioesterase [Haloechinothrix halophila]|uniref:acyl-CoA thioesterase n=1 Tax=Haloechinothrix halophila TaxID=1069073 RepID=UPI00041580C0|nr:acyl-CoA thioesterase [Haloechinothrix halophila]